jgi:hypothetical protein
MSATPFKASGALSDEHAAIYIERQTDHYALTHLRAMDYLLVIEPRQQGKTSLINHLMCHPALGDVAFAYVDVTTPDRSTETAWYQTLCPRILRQLRGFIPRDQWPTVPQNSAGWRDFLCDVAMCATDAHRRVVIALDEIGAVTFPGATEFFSVLRDVYNSRQAETEFKQLTFLLSGAFHPRDLIEDDKISPFNIAQRVRLPDFTEKQVRELVGKGDWSVEQATTLAERIRYWTDGQPYLTQLLCSYLGPDAMTADVDASVERLRREDENHLPPLLERLNSDAKLRGYVDRIMVGERIKFYPRENRRQAQLELLGVIKADAEGYCIIRNRIYVQALGGFDEISALEERKDEMTSPHRVDSPIAIPQELTQQMSKGNVVLFVGAGLSIGAGLPGWGALIRPLAERIGYTEDDLLKAAQFYENRNGRHALVSHLRDRLDTTGIEPTENHDLLARLPINIVFTTNFDDLLGRAYRKAGRSVNVVVGATELPFWDESRVNLVKLHGTCDRPDSFIITERDYNTIYRSNALIVQQLNALLATKTFLFIGYSVSDPDFNQIYDQLSIDLGRHQRRPYLVTFDVDEFKMEDLERRGYHVISLSGEGDRNAQLAEWLWALLDAVAGPTSEAVTPSLSAAPRPQSKPKVPQPSIPAKGGSGMDYERGLNALKELAQGTDWYQDFTVHEAALRDNLRDERRYGPSEQTRRDRTRIVDQLNALALMYLSISFNDLCVGKQLPPKSQLVVAALVDSRLGSEPLRLADVLSIHPEHDGCPHKAGPAQWFSRLRIESQTLIHGCWGKIYEIRRLNGPDDQQSASLPEFHASFLSWGSRGKSGLFEPISIQPKDTEYLDLVWRAHDDPPIPESQLRVASALDHGERSTCSSDWGKRQDFIPLEPGYYLLVVQVWAEGYNIPVECTYRLHWPGPGQEDNIRLVEIVRTQGSKGDGASTGPEPLYGAGNRWAVLVGVNEYEDKANYGQLHVCVKDVHTIRKQLVAGGFDPARIRLLTDDTSELPTRDSILVALKAVADATEPDDLLLFYYSGHGDEDDSESYLVARNGKRLVLSDTAIRVSRVKEIMEQAPARAKVIVLDACHSGADIGGKGPKLMSAEFIRRVFEQAEGLAILASCKQGQLSYEWQTRERSVFTHFLLEALEGQADLDEKGFVTVQDANRHVVNGVKLWASQRNVSQTPTLQYIVAGDIILTRLGIQPSKDTPAPSPRVVVSVPLPENAWSRFQKLAEAREKTPEAYLDLLIEMECEQIKPGTDMRLMPVHTEWPVQQVEVDSSIFERLKRLGGAPPEHRLSKLIRDVTKTGG